jgi:hypothetical protein
VDAARLPRDLPSVPTTTAITPDAASAPFARVTLARRDARDSQQRQVEVRLDDGAATTLLYGDTTTIEVKPGRHVLKANNTLVWKRMPFVIGHGEHIEFQLINRPGRLTLGFLALLGVAPLFLTIERRDTAKSAP